MKEFGVLPRAGGLYDQDYDTMRAVWHVVEAWREQERIEAEKAKAKKK